MIGTTLGHYRIQEALGAGGMGEVFIAHDTKLDRKVALKVLHASIAGDPDRRERFAREARAIAALNHPDIVTVYSVEDEGDTYFLTMELIEGRTLADLIPARGFALDQLLKTAIPLADAVSAAHTKGITHRDLKPANVMVTTDGRVKVLDFGLAKLRDDAPQAADSMTAMGPLTGEGKIVGTVTYMSPEQAEGKAVDHRSDIFSLGVMLYEMATGERPFKGDSTVSTLSSILRDTPRSVTEINPGVPRDLAKIVRRALTKDPEHRFQSAKDLRNELEELKQDLASGELASPVGGLDVRRRPARAWWPWAALAAVAVVAVWFLLPWLRQAPAVTPLQVAFTQLTSAAGSETGPSLSPDGKWIVYSSAGDIQLQKIGGQVPINLTKDEPAADITPAFSPNGELIAFRSERGGGGLFVMSPTGEAVRRLTDRGFDPAWTPDGRFIVFATASTLDPESRTNVGEGWRVDVTSGQATRITAGDFTQPSVSPNNRRIAYWALPVTAGPDLEFSSNSRDLWTMRVDGTDIVRVTDDAATDWSPTWSPDGRYLYFASDRGGSMNLWRIGIDETSGRVRGEPEAVTTPSAWVGQISRSGDGRLLAYASFTFARNISRIAFDAARGTTAGAEEAITTGTLDWTRPEPSPDGASLVMTSYHRQEDIFISKADGSGRRSLTNDVDKDRTPHWSPDGRQIAFYSNRGGPFSLWTINPDGGNLRQRVAVAASLLYPTWSPDGSKFVATQLASRRVHVFALSDQVVTEPVETLAAPPSPSARAGFAAWSWSADGRSLVGYGGSPSTIWVYSFDTKTYKEFAQGVTPVWLSDGRRVVYQVRGRLRLLDTVTGLSSEIFAKEGETLGDPHLTRDDKQLYFTHAVTGADIWLMTMK